MEYNGPDKFRPISPWAYFGYTVLYAIPIIGLIFLIIHSISQANINRRNFARSYWCTLLLALIIIAVALIIAFAVGALHL